MQTHYRIDDFQETYFVLGHLDELLELAQIDFAPIYDRLNGASEHDAGAVLASDQVLTRGTLAYHDAKREKALA